MRCLVKSINERNPCQQLDFSAETASVTGRKEGMMSGQYFPYALGENRATMASTKSESLVIADQHVAVNTFPGLVHTARQTMRVTNTRSPFRRPKVGEMIGVKS